MSELVIPAFCYLPLCRSVDTWTYVLRPLPSEGHAFNTKARCPALMLFEVEEHRELRNDLYENNSTMNNSSKNNKSSSNDVLDVATFLGSELQEYSEETIIMARSVKSSLSVTTAPLTAPGAPAIQLHSLFSKKMNESTSSTSTSSLTASIRKNQFWKPQGTGLLKLSAAEALAADIPKQNVENNHALKNIAKNAQNENENKNENGVRIAPSTSTGKKNRIEFY